VNRKNIQSEDVQERKKFTLCISNCIINTCIASDRERSQNIVEITSTSSHAPNGKCKMAMMFGKTGLLLIGALSKHRGIQLGFALLRSGEKPTHQVQSYESAQQQTCNT
jgi:hypothetical protein